MMRIELDTHENDHLQATTCYSLCCCIFIMRRKQERSRRMTERMYEPSFTHQFTEIVVEDYAIDSIYEYFVKSQSNLIYKIIFP